MLYNDLYLYTKVTLLYTKQYMYIHLLFGSVDKAFKRTTKFHKFQRFDLF